jgi:hypothetical protein
VRVCDVGVLASACAFVVEREGERKSTEIERGTLDHPYSSLPTR